MEGEWEAQAPRSRRPAGEVQPEGEVGGWMGGSGGDRGSRYDISVRVRATAVWVLSMIDPGQVQPLCVQPAGSYRTDSIRIRAYDADVWNFDFSHFKCRIFSSPFSFMTLPFLESRY